jgi:hypothetical protein
MMNKVVLLISLCLSYLVASSQTTIGLGLYPTGSEVGLGLRLNKDKRLSIDARCTRTSYFSDVKQGQTNFVTELSAIYRVILLEKLRFHIGLGFRGDWNLVTSNKYGAIIPIGVEAFPFPFQNAGLIFEAAPYCVSDIHSKLSGGIRTVAGFVFYFPTKSNKPKE